MRVQPTEKVTRRYHESHFLLWLAPRTFLNCQNFIRLPGTCSAAKAGMPCVGFQLPCLLEYIIRLFLPSIARFCSASYTLCSWSGQIASCQLLLCPAGSNLPAAAPGWLVRSTAAASRQRSGRSCGCQHFAESHPCRARGSISHSSRSILPKLPCSLLLALL